MCWRGLPFRELLEEGPLSLDNPYWCHLELYTLLPEWARTEHLAKGLQWPLVRSKSLECPRKLSPDCHLSLCPILAPQSLPCRLHINQTPVGRTSYSLVLASLWLSWEAPERDPGGFPLGILWVLFPTVLGHWLTLFAVVFSVFICCGTVTCCWLPMTSQDKAVPLVNSWNIKFIIKCPECFCSRNCHIQQTKIFIKFKRHPIASR